MTAISYHHTVNDLPDPLCWGNGPFSRREWFALLEEAGHKPLLAVARDDCDVICLPLTQGARGLEALTNWYAFTWSPNATIRLCTAPWEELARDLAGQASRVDLPRLPDEGSWARLLEQAFRRTGWIVLRNPCDTNHILRVQGRSFSEYLADRPGQLRTTLSRKASKVSVTLATQFDPAHWHAYEEIYADSWKPEEGDPAMLRRFAQNESAAGRYRFGIAHHAGEPVAAQFWTVEAATACIHKLAHRKTAGKLSPGTTLTAALFEQVIDIDRVALVDFGTGDEAYKRDWMEETRTRWHLTCLRPDASGNWPAIAKAIMRKLVSRRAAG